MKSITELVDEVATEKRELVKQIFEEYCKKEIGIALDRVSKTRKIYDDAQEKLDSLSLDRLKEDFNSMNHSLGCSPKDFLLARGANDAGDIYYRTK